VARARVAQTAAAAALAGLALAVWGGYARHWRWTGFRGRADLWDWLHVVLLPLAFALAPLWLRHRGRLGPARQAALAACGLGFGLLVALGYALHLSWTGFPGNTLWDWLQLFVAPLVLPLVLAPLATRWLMEPVSEEGQDGASA